MKPPPQRAKRTAAPASAHTRDRAATQERILAAVGAVLARDGFAALGVNALAREAGVDKVLIYRYFGSLPELLTLWGASERFWPSAQELLGHSSDAQAAFLLLPVAERYALFFERFIDALRARPLTVEILAAEIVERNELTAILETEREQWGHEVESLFGGAEFRARPELRGTTLLLVAGVQYLLVRARTIRVFGGIDLHSDAGWSALKHSLRALAQTLLAGDAPGRAQAARGAARPSASAPKKAARSRTTR